MSLHRNRSQTEEVYLLAEEIKTARWKLSRNWPLTVAANIWWLIHSILEKYKGNAGEYGITDEMFLVSMDHDIRKVNGLNQWVSDVTDYAFSE